MYHDVLEKHPIEHSTASPSSGMMTPVSADTQTHTHTLHGKKPTRECLYGDSAILLPPHNPTFLPRFVPASSVFPRYLLTYLVPTEHHPILSSVRLAQCAG